MTTKDEALRMALDALTCIDDDGEDRGHRCGQCDDYVDRNGHVRAAIREALAQQDEQALHAGAAVPSEALSLSGDAKLAHDQCRAVAHLANSFAEVYAALAAIVAHDAKLSDLIGDASASAMEWLGDELNAMDAATEDDGWLDQIFEAAQKRWPQHPQRRPQKDEQEPVAWYVPPSSRLLLGEYAKHDAEAEARRCGGTARAIPLYTTPPKCQPLTEDDVADIWSRYSDEIGNVSIEDAEDIARAIEAAHGIGAEK